LEWLLPMRKWVLEIAMVEAPGWWTDRDCESVIPVAEHRVETLIGAAKHYHRTVTRISPDNKQCAA